MQEKHIRIISGLAGIAMGLTVIAVIPLYFVYDGIPPPNNIFTRALLTLFSAVFALVFFSGFTYLIRAAGTSYDWLASIVWGSSLLYIAAILIGAAHEAGVAFNAPGIADPTIDGPLADANILIHGSIKRILSAVLLFAAGVAAPRAGLIPRWMGSAALLIGLINFAFVPSIFFGKDPTQFYSAIGWGNTAMVGSLIMYWIVGVSVALMRAPKK